MIILFSIIRPATFDGLFFIFVETLVLCSIVFVMSFIAKDFLDGMMQVLVSIFVIPIMLFFVACGFFLVLLIFSGGPEYAAQSGQPLLSLSWSLIDDPAVATSGIISYLGSDLIWIIVLLVFYYVASIFWLKFSQKKTVLDLWFSMKKQFMLQSITLLLAALFASVILSAGIGYFDQHPWFAYLIIIVFRLMIEFWKFYMEKPEVKQN
ncbi:MAG: hypothetical protein IPM74_14680 [Crocinitomicaceae bacterium]|nr:hypothetical protein [Crocinitomicaceae bacterium]MBK8927116.1 hypothetical protein [Crocinitomicaceae bacterium]